MPNLGGGELVFILVIVLIVFGAGKLPDVFAQLGKGVKTFRDESTGAAERTTVASQPAAPVSSAAATGRHCTNCGTALVEGAKFCPSCGRPAA